MAIQDTEGKNSSTRQLARGGRTAILFNGLGQGLRLGLQLILTRFLGADAYGLYSLGRSILEVAVRVGLAGFQNTVVRFIPQYQKLQDMDRLIGVVVVSGIGVFILSCLAATTLWMLAGFIAFNVFEKPEMLNVIQAFSFVLPGYAILIYMAFCARGLKNMALYSGSLEVTHPALIIAISTGLFLSGFKILGALIGFVAATYLLTILVAHGLRNLLRHIDTRTDKRWTTLKFESKEIIPFAVSVFFLGFAQIVLSHTDRIMLGAFVPEAQIGIYAIAALLAQKIAFFQAAINGIFAPLLAGIYDKNKINDDVLSLFKTTTKFTQIFSIPVMIAILFGGGDLLDLFGSNFRDGWPILTVLAVAQYINISAGPVGYMLVMTGRQNLEFLNSVALSIINIVLNLLFIPQYGAIGAAIATGISIATINVVRLIQVFRIFGHHPYKLNLAPTVLSFLIICALIGWYFDSVTPVLMERIIVILIAIIAQLTFSLTMFLDSSDRDTRDSLLNRIPGI